MNVYVGMVLKGYCYGYFGRDSYGDKRVEAVGADWIVVREDDGEINLAVFENTAEMEKYVEEWII